MASTNKTTNYELSQFVETDRPAWLTDYNGDMRTIDSIMKAISDVASGASGSVSELADRMSTAEGNITTNANDIDALEARADSLEAQAQSTAGTIANIQTEQTAQNLGIEAATELGYNLARPYDSASTYAVGAYVLFQNTLYKCITAVSTGEAFDPAKWLAIKATDEIAEGGYTLPVASDTVLGGIKISDNFIIASDETLKERRQINQTGVLSFDTETSITPPTGTGGVFNFGSTQIVGANSVDIGRLHIVKFALNTTITTTSAMTSVGEFSFPIKKGDNFPNSNLTSFCHTTLGVKTSSSPTSIHNAVLASNGRIVGSTFKIYLGLPDVATYDLSIMCTMFYF